MPRVNLPLLPLMLHPTNLPNLSLAIPIEPNNEMLKSRKSKRRNRRRRRVTAQESSFLQRSRPATLDEKDDIKSAAKSEFLSDKLDQSKFNPKFVQYVVVEGSIGLVGLTPAAAAV